MDCLRRNQIPILAGLALVALAIVVDLATTDPWRPRALSSRCERPWRPHAFLREPTNALSNMAFCAVAIRMLLLQTTASWSTIYALATWTTGITSFWYHASQSIDAAECDLVALVYLLAVVMATTVRAWLRSEAAFVGIVVVSVPFTYVLADGTVFGWAGLLASGATVLGVTAVAAVLAIRRAGEAHTAAFVRAAVAMVFALIAWIPEEIMHVCVPHGGQPSLHAVFHVLAAVAIAYHHEFLCGIERAANDAPAKSCPLTETA